MIHDPFEVLFFSRGRGHSHAIRDMAIADELAKLRNDIGVRFVSYGTGAATFVELGRPVTDLGMPDSNPLWETVARAGAVIAQERPQLVVAHEEFAAVPLAKALGIPAVFITDWFAEAEDLFMQALHFVDEVVFVDEPGLFDEPPYLEGKVHYVGPMLRRLRYTRSDRGRARQELGFPPNSTIILVVPGGYATEARAPIAEIVLPAFELLRMREKLLVWVAGADSDALERHLDGRTDVMIKDYDWQIDRLMVASDVGITKANRTTVRELAALGIRSVSLSQGSNPIDDAVVEQIPTNAALDSRTATARTLAEAMLDALNSPAVETSERSNGCDQGNRAALLAAQRIIHHLDRAQERSGKRPACGAGTEA